MKVLVTGANGFIGKNLLVHLYEKNIEVISFTRQMSSQELGSSLKDVSFVFHLAGSNRPSDEAEFKIHNFELTQKLCNFIRDSGRVIPVLHTSSIQAEMSNAYGVSKLAAENALISLAEDSNSPVYLYRLSNVFGKWSRPNYNSAVATFSYNIANNKVIEIKDPDSLINLVYIDDVIKDFLRILEEQPKGVVRPKVLPEHTITVGSLADHIRSFKDGRELLCIGTIGIGLTRALYATYLSFLSPAQFSYPLPSYSDERGSFVEVLKTKDSGQLSFITAPSGITRGGHYHHSKSEKFVVVKGSAKFSFKHIVTEEVYEILSEGKKTEVIEIVPGWSHEITNVGNSEMIVMIWANEIFDRQRPDTVTYKD
mgnify:CR=1 FL=1|tara:strand:- start:14 stop:1117 length:1104 start_codon:yes stop_codon:yes gene_type:complete